MPEVAFVMSARQPRPLRQFASALRMELNRQGVPSSLQTEFPEPHPGRVYLLVSPRDYVRAYGEMAMPDPAILRRTAFLGAENPANLGSARHLELLRRAGAVFDVGQRAVSMLHGHGIAARLLRPGYQRELDRFESEAPRPIDIMFLGVHSDRRTRYLRDAADVLARRFSVVRISDETLHAQEAAFPDPATLGVLLAQTKIVINLHRFQEPALEWLNVLEAIHCGAVIVSEHSTGIAPFSAGEHLLVATPESLPHVVQAALRDEARLGRMRRGAYERLRDWLPLAASVSVLRAALVELVGNPASPGLSLGAPQHKDEALDADRGPESDSIQRQLRGVRYELVDMRRQLSRLQAVVEIGASGDRAPTRMRIVHRNSAWSSCRGARVSVLLALGEGPHAARVTLDSLLRSRLREIELVVVGMNSAPALREVEDWLRDHPRLASTLVAFGPGYGAGAARNVALDFARSPYCLVLEPGVGLYPRCVQQLTAVLDGSPEAAFAYCLQAVEGDADGFVAAGGDYLLSTADWDLQRLRQGNPIQPPSLIRRMPLRELGGFATSAVLDGWEDYDLWCRIAGRGWQGRLLPEILAWRAVSAADGILASMHPSPGAATSLLTERSPRLLSGAFTPV